MTRKSVLLKALELMAISMSYNTNSSETKRQLRTSDLSLKIRPAPKGCQRYYFDSHGYDYPKNFEGSVFNCLATTEKIAYEKFNKWRMLNPAVK